MKFICFIDSKVVLIGNEKFAEIRLDSFLIKNMVRVSNCKVLRNFFEKNTVSRWLFPYLMFWQDSHYSYETSVNKIPTLLFLTW